MKNLKKFQKILKLKPLRSLNNLFWSLAFRRSKFTVQQLGLKTALKSSLFKIIMHAMTLLNRCCYSYLQKQTNLSKCKLNLNYTNKSTTHSPNLPNFMMRIVSIFLKNHFILLKPNSDSLVNYFQSKSGSTINKLDLHLILSNS